MPFGIGSIIDFPNESLMMAGLDAWEDMKKFRIYDQRLANWLSIDYFQVPPSKSSKFTKDSDQNHDSYLPYVRFPLWYYCPYCRSMKKADWNDSSIPRCDSKYKANPNSRSCSSLKGKNRRRMIPIRFIIACENGHIDDFPWIEWAHSIPGQSLDKTEICENPNLRFISTGSPGLEGLKVQCISCHKSRSLYGSAGQGALIGLKCKGNRPWLGPEGREKCIPEKEPIMLQRGATNLYFPDVATSILIPPFSGSNYRREIDDPEVWNKIVSWINEGKCIDDFLDVFLLNKNLDKNRMKAIIKEKISTDIGKTEDEEDYRYKEYIALQESAEDIEDDFHTVKQDMKNYKRWISDFFESIVLVEKMSVTHSLTGFSRIFPPSYDKKNVMVLSLKKKNWLPGIRIYGEGFFLKLDQKAIETWIKKNSRKLSSRYLSKSTTLNIKSVKINPEFYLLHTLAHILIRQTIFECGYGTSALRERIYFSNKENRKMNGILVYTAAGDCEGTMGGLSQQGSPGYFEDLLENALRKAIWCSNDPLCMESRGQGISSLNLGACFACTLLPETSCEEGNKLLDRFALTGSLQEPESGFFGNIINELMAGNNL